MRIIRHEHPSAQVLVVSKGKLAVIMESDGEQEPGEADERSGIRDGGDQSA